MSGKPLGRGISALLGENQYAATQRGGPGAKSAGIAALPIEQLSPGVFQPRQRFNEEELNDLADSIRKNGIVQPIIARQKSDGTFEIIAGERRWRAAKIAGLSEIPAIVRTLTDREALEIALIENIQRQDLMPLEVAEGYRRLIEQFDYTQETLADALGKSRSQVANFLRLLTLPPPVQDMLRDGRLSAGHARTLVGSAHAAALAEQVVKRGLNVRQTEKLAQKYAGFINKQRLPRSEEENEAKRSAEQKLSRVFGMPVTVNMKGPGKGAITIAYQSTTDLKRLVDFLYSYAEYKQEKPAAVSEPLPA